MLQRVFSPILIGGIRLQGRLKLNLYKKNKVVGFGPAANHRFYFDKKLLARRQQDPARYGEISLRWPMMTFLKKLVAGDFLNWANTLIIPA